jgi:NAD(P)-dependent dehydrogenase (short-subunit alcohol dehydrogenase family)
MSEKTVVVTGGLTGIGEECALKFAHEGYNVVFSGRDSQRGEELLARLRTITTESHFMIADVTRENQVVSLVERTLGIYDRIDVVLNAAGTEGHPAPIEHSTAADFQQVFDTNVLGTQLVMKHVLLVMRRQQSGCMINISSQAGHVGIPGGGVYAASKHAVNGLTRSAALEVAADGVRVNAIAPGPVATDMFERFVGRDETVKAQFLKKMPTNRIVTTEEIAATALFLASDAARSIIGQIITVDGGYSVG